MVEPVEERRPLRAQCGETVGHPPHGTCSGYPSTFWIPATLWYQAQREHPADENLRRSRYQSLMRAHGFIVDRTPENEPKHNHVTRDIKDCGSGCPACDEYHARRRMEREDVIGRG